MIGIIGGTGLYRLDGLENLQTGTVETPFGLPSAALTTGYFGREKVAFLPRHGQHHQLLPGEINYRANIWALKSVGVRQIIGVSAAGSLAKEIAPGDFALPDQYFDWTSGRRIKTFFGDGLVAHVSTATPTCPSLARRIVRSGEKEDVRVQSGKVYACVEGPRLGSRAESHFLKNSGCHLVGMTNVPEAFLAREAQVCYCTIAIVTDYDCWLDDPNEHVSLEKVMAIYGGSLKKAKSLLRRLLGESGGGGGSAVDVACTCRESLKNAVMTNEKDLSEEKRQILSFLRE